MNKTYRFRLKPTNAQATALSRQAGMSRFVFNWALASRKEHYGATGEILPYRVLSARLTQLKREESTAWLKDADAQALQQSLRDLDRAYRNFFEKRAGFPRFKSKHRSQLSFRTPQGARVQDGKVYCPKIGWIKLRQSQPVTEQTKSATFKRDALGHWYVTLVTEFEMPNTALPEPTHGVGVDLGLESFLTLDDGSKIAAPQFFRASAKNLAKAQRKLSRKKKGSKNREKQRRKLAKVYAKSRNQRNDFLHKLSTDLVSRYDLIAVEDLNVKGLAKTKLAKSILDASWSGFVRQLEYKCQWNRKHFIKIDRFAPTSKTCSACGAIKDQMPLAVRDWACDCGAVHDRDTNAAKNILSLGLKAVGHTVSACGVDVRPSE